MPFGILRSKQLSRRAHYSSESAPQQAFTACRLACGRHCSHAETLVSTATQTIRNFPRLSLLPGLQNEGFGKFRVLRDLQSKRVSSGVVAASRRKNLRRRPTKEELIDAYLARKYRSVVLHDFLKEDKNVASAYRRLRTAGFSSSATLAALKRHGQRAADWEEPPEED